MDTIERIAKIESRWCIGCKHCDMQIIIHEQRGKKHKRRENRCPINIMLHSRLVMGEPLPAEIDLHKCMCSKFERKKS